VTASPWQYFSLEELSCPCCGRMEMEAGFMSKVVTLRRNIGLPFIVSSGFRCPDHNASVSSTGLSGPHTTGRALDILCQGYLYLKILAGALTFDFTGIGARQHGEHARRFVHLDDLPEADGRPRPWGWTYP